MNRCLAAAIVLLGERGVGKTYVARHILADQNARHKMFPRTSYEYTPTSCVQHLIFPPADPTKTAYSVFDVGGDADSFDHAKGTLLHLRAIYVVVINRVGRRESRIEMPPAEQAEKWLRIVQSLPEACRAGPPIVICPEFMFEEQYNDPMVSFRRIYTPGEYSIQFTPLGVRKGLDAVYQRARDDPELVDWAALVALAEGAKVARGDSDFVTDYPMTIVPPICRGVTPDKVGVAIRPPELGLSEGECLLGPALQAYQLYFALNETSPPPGFTVEEFDAFLQDAQAPMKPALLQAMLGRFQRNIDFMTKLGVCLGLLKVDPERRVRTTARRPRIISYMARLMSEFMFPASRIDMDGMPSQKVDPNARVYIKMVGEKIRVEVKHAPPTGARS